MAGETAAAHVEAEETVVAVMAAVAEEMMEMEEEKMVAEERVEAQPVETAVAAVEVEHTAMTGLQTGSQHPAGMLHYHTLLQMSPRCTHYSMRRRTAHR